MSNPPAFRTETDYSTALEAQKKAFEAWSPGEYGKAIMFFPTFTDVGDIPPVPGCAIVVGSLKEEPGMFWVHNWTQVGDVLWGMRDGTWVGLLGIVDGITEENAHEFTKIVVAQDPDTGVEWSSIAAKDQKRSLKLQVEILQRQFPTAIVKVLDQNDYSRK
jgi:hypothetical protein